ncbi:hypothetical protein F5Y04DRAFT_243120 [Hypomontagnella monticulosa]|nr:hypothetical protein F5Y04DRAFT_243120 [Hypomontagnella monticulosa]
MSTPFICRQCIARLTQSRSGRWKSKKFQLHTQAVSTSIPQPPWSFAENQRRDPAVNRDIMDGYELPIPESHSIPTPQTIQNEPMLEQKHELDGYLNIKKFAPRRRPDVEAVSHRPVENARDLKSKILRSLGNYGIVHKDLMSIYGLSRQEARHAVGQLGRLLWGHSPEEAGIRLDLFHIWKNHFNELLHIVDESHLTAETDADPSRSNVWTDPKKQDLETVKDVWHRLDQERRELLWPQMIINAFRSNPGTLPGLIQGTLQPSWCPSYIVEDIVYLLLRNLDDTYADRNKRRKVQELVFSLLEHCPPKYLVLEETVIRKIMSSMPTPKLWDFYQALKKVEHPLHPNTLLHFASRFANKSEYKVQAADIIHSLSSVPGFDINSPAAASVCTTLLNVEENDALPDEHAAPDELFKMLLDAGLRPNLLNLSALMRNFCVRGRVEVAWNIFDLLNQYGIEPDAHVFSILLNGSKLALDFESMQRILSMIQARKGWSVRLINDLLDYIYQNNQSNIESRGPWRRRQKKENNARAWRLMVRVYSKFFKIAPLQRLTLFRIENVLAPRSLRTLPDHLQPISQLISTLPPLPDALIMRPSSVTLGLMLKAHLRSIPNPKPLQRYHLHIKKLLYRGDKTIVRLTRDCGTMVHDILIQQLTQFQATLQIGVQVIDEMHAASKQEKMKYGRNSRHPWPSVHTYTILMNGLRNHNHTRGVLAALRMMIKENLTPNILTWNTVIGALLRSERFTDAVRVMRYLEKTGVETNARTVREVTRLGFYGRKRVALLMEKMRDSPVGPMDPLAFVESLLNRGIGRRQDQIPIHEIHRMNTERRERERRAIFDEIRGGGM